METMEPADLIDVAGRAGKMWSPHVPADLIDVAGRAWRLWSLQI